MAAVTGVAAALSLAVTACSGSTSRATAGVEQASAGAVASSAATPTTTDESAEGPDADADAGDPEAQGELGPTAVRVLDVAKGPAGGVRISVVGPDGARYRLRTRAGVESCTQQAGAVDATPLPGLPINAVRHAQLRCAAARSVRAVTAGKLTVSVAAGAEFTYTFEVPVRPRA